MKKSRKSFGGTIGFVMAAAASAVGLGNIWRFPYLAAKDGGGVFLIVYIALALTFGFTLITAELSIGRSTRRSPILAYEQVKKGWGPLGWIACLVPFIILPYYVSIGGWVLKYFIAYVTGNGALAAQDGYFGSFITSVGEPVVMMAIFLAAVVFIVVMGVEKGIEKSSKILMPLLLLLVAGIAGFALTISHTDAENVTRTGLEGLKVYVIPDFTGMTLKRFAVVLMDAMGQMFYSLSVAMGILVTYGSYVSDETDMAKSVNHIELIDTLIAFLAGVMIIPAVYTFMGRSGMEASGPSLMFVSLPKVFSAMGPVGNIIACLFFAMVFFAALTSAVSVMEAVVSSMMDAFNITRKTGAVLETIIAGVLGIVVCFGYNLFYFEITLPNGAAAQILDVMDYVSNNIFMPVVAIATCILIGWVVQPSFTIKEFEKNGIKMGRKKLFTVMIRYITPLLMFVLFLKAVGIVNI